MKTKRIKYIIIIFSIAIMLLYKETFTERIHIKTSGEVSNSTSYLTDEHSVYFYFTPEKDIDIAVKVKTIIWDHEFENTDFLCMRLLDRSQNVIAERQIPCRRLLNGVFSEIVLFEDVQLKNNCQYSIEFYSTLDSEDGKLALSCVNAAGQNYFTMEDGVIRSDNVEVLIYE